MYEANMGQKWLHECYKDMVERIRDLKPAPIVVANGDMIQGVNRQDGQLISNNLADQVRAAETLLAPIVEASERFYMVRGTEWHDGRAAEDVESLARALGAIKDPDTEQSTWWELYLDLGGPVIHCAHHVGVSSVPWYEATVPLRDTLLQLSELSRFYGPEAPNLRMVVRSHRHRFISVFAPPDLQTVVTPAWQLRTAFAYKKAASMLPQIGWVLAVWDGEDIVLKPRIYSLPPIHVETIGGAEDADQRTRKWGVEPREAARSREGRAGWLRRLLDGTGVGREV
jgi:hypothetical protein